MVWSTGSGETADQHGFAYSLVEMLIARNVFSMSHPTKYLHLCSCNGFAQHPLQLRQLRKNEVPAQGRGPEVEQLEEVHAMSDPGPLMQALRQKTGNELIHLHAVQARPKSIH